VILVDTHTVGLAFDQNQLSKKARLAINDARKSGDGRHSHVRAASKVHKSSSTPVLPST
jgi:hypothetical protein